MLQHLYADCSILLHILPLDYINCLTCFYPECLVQITTPVLTEIKQGRADPNCGGRREGGGAGHRAGKLMLSRRPTLPSAEPGGPPPPPVLPGERSRAALPAAGGRARQPRAQPEGPLLAARAKGLHPVCQGSRRGCGRLESRSGPRTRPV